MPRFTAQGPTLGKTIVLADEEHGYWFSWRR